MILSLQLYTVRHFMRKDLFQTLHRIAEIGYNAIEVYSIPLSPSMLADLKNACTSNNILAHSFQLKYKQLKDTRIAIPFLQSAGCKVAVVAALPFNLFHASEEELGNFYRELNVLGAQYKREGITLAYHHHNYEAMLFNKVSGFQIIDQTLDTDLVKLVCDTYWLQQSGYCPENFIRRHIDAIEGIHLRDFSVERKMISPRLTDCALGKGTLNASAVLKAAKNAKVSYCAIEQNSKTPFDDIKRSLNYINKINT